MSEELDSICGVAEETVYAMFVDPEDGLAELEPEDYAQRNQTKRDILCPRASSIFCHCLHNL